MSSTQTTVEIRGDASSLKAEMDDAVRSLGRFGRTVDITNKEAVAAWRESAAATREIAPALKATEQQARDLEAVIAATESRIDSMDRRFATGAERMTRGMQFMARSGDLAGRGMATMLASASDIAFAFGPEGAIVGAVAIGLLAVVDFFNRAEKEAKKSQKAIDEWALHLVKAGDPGRMEGFATGQRSIVRDLQEQIDDKKKQLDEFNKADASGGDFGSGQQAANLQKEIDLLERRKKAAQGWSDSLKQQAKQTREKDDLETAVDKLRTDLQQQRSEILRREGDLQRANAEGHFKVALAAQALLDRLDGQASATEKKLRSLIALNSDILGVNAEKENRQLDRGDEQFNDSRRAISDRDPMSAAATEQKRFDAIVDKIPDVIDKRLNEQTAEQRDIAQKQLQALAGFGTTELPERFGDEILKAWEKGLKEQAQENKKHHLAPGEQFTVPENVQKNLETREGTTGEFGPFGFLKKIPDALSTAGDSFRRFADVSKKGLSDVEAAGEALYTSFSNASRTALDEMVRRHQVSMPLVKKALGEPIITYLEGLAIKDAADAVSDAASGNWAKAGREAAAAVEAGAAATAAGSLFGMGGSGGGGSGSGGSGGGGTGGSLARGGKQQPIQMEILITDQRTTTRGAARQKQSLQRVDDLNQPYRLSL